MLVALLTAVAKAIVTARLALGRAAVEETHERTSWNTEKDPTAWRNMAYLRAWSASSSFALWFDSPRRTQTREGKHS